MEKIKLLQVVALHGFFTKKYRTFSHEIWFFMSVLMEVE